MWKLINRCLFLLVLPVLMMLPMTSNIHIQNASADEQCSSKIMEDLGALLLTQSPATLLKGAKDYLEHCRQQQTSPEQQQQQPISCDDGYVFMDRGETGGPRCYPIPQYPNSDGTCQQGYQLGRVEGVDTQDMCYRSDTFRNDENVPTYLTNSTDTFRNDENVPTYLTNSTDTFRNDENVPTYLTNSTDTVCTPNCGYVTNATTASTAGNNVNPCPPSFPVYRPNSGDPDGFVCFEH